MKQYEFVNELLVTRKNNELNQVFKLINKILLLQYSERIFSANKRAATSTLLHNAHLITLFLKRITLSQNFSFSQRYKAMNIETIETRYWAFGNLMNYEQNKVLKLINNYIVSIFREDFLGQRKSCNLDTLARCTSNHALSNAL